MSSATAKGSYSYDNACAERGKGCGETAVSVFNDTDEMSNRSYLLDHPRRLTSVGSLVLTDVKAAWIHSLPRSWCAVYCRRSPSRLARRQDRVRSRSRERHLTLWKPHSTPTRRHFVLSGTPGSTSTCTCSPASPVRRWSLRSQA